MRVCGPLSECNRVCVALFGSVSQARTMCAWRGLLSRRTRCRVKSNMRSRGHVGVVFASRGARVARDTVNNAELRRGTALESGTQE